MQLHLEISQAHDPSEPLNAREPLLSENAVVAHLIEIAVFAVAIQLAIAAGLVTLEPPQPTFGDLFYFSATVYSSLGFGDVIPTGPVRQLVGIEAVAGLVLIAWTASFTYVGMERFWDNGE